MSPAANERVAARRIVTGRTATAERRQPALTGDRRSAPRTALRMPAEFRPSGYGAYPVRVMDVSPFGARIIKSGWLDVDERSWIKFPTIESWQARVAWCRDNQAGIAFDRPLHPAVAETLVRRILPDRRSR